MKQIIFLLFCTISLSANCQVVSWSHYIDSVKNEISFDTVRVKGYVIVIDSIESDNWQLRMQFPKIGFVPDSLFVDKFRIVYDYYHNHKEKSSTHVKIEGTPVNIDFLVSDFFMLPIYKDNFRSWDYINLNNLGIGVGKAIEFPKCDSSLYTTKYGKRPIRIYFLDGIFLKFSLPQKLSQPTGNHTFSWIFNPDIRNLVGIYYYLIGYNFFSGCVQLNPVFLEKL